MSRTKLLREPEERKDRIGGITARLLPTLAILGGLKERGGRDFTLVIRILADSIVFGSSSSRCRCAHFVELSACCASCALSTA